MKKHKNFDQYKNSLLEIINKREPGVHTSPFESVYPETYINNPIQFVSLDKIENLPEQAIVTKHGLEQLKEMGVEPNAGDFHGARLGRQVDIPIAVKANSDGTFTIVDGTHRVVQALISNNDSVVAFVEGGRGPTLEDIFNINKTTIL